MGLQNLPKIGRRAKRVYQSSGGSNLPSAYLSPGILNEICKIHISSLQGFCRTLDDVFVAGNQRRADILPALRVRRSECGLHRPPKLFRLRKLLTAATRLVQFSCTLALIDDAGLLEEAAVAHFYEDAVTLHNFVEPAECRLERLIVFYCDTSHEITFFRSIAD